MPSREDAIQQLANVLNLSEEAIHFAQCWDGMPDPFKRHMQLLIDEHITTMAPSLAPIYANASRSDQERFNAIVEAAQERLRRPAP